MRGSGVLSFRRVWIVRAICGWIAGEGGGLVIGGTVWVCPAAVFVAFGFGLVEALGYFSGTG
jgi:hypothetical protein